MKFKISSALKNIIGKDLITNDFIAIFELVKNSYDAGAKKVTISFENDKVIIADNGKGMSKDDVEKKWLFVAYSAKKEGTEDFRDKAQKKRHYAGAKGIGRFSCDRLGNKLKMITKTAKCQFANILNVNWSHFEEDAKKEFIDINVLHENLVYEDLNQGTILEITQLPKDSIWDKKKIADLKRSLEKLINPFESLSKDQEFIIDIKCQYQELCGLVQNQVFQRLNLKTTQIICNIDNKAITTELTDRGTSLYKIQEPNTKFPKLENISINLFHLSRAAKLNFSKSMGISSVNFGSIFIFKNGFRVAPFGDDGDDSLQLDKRKSQGYARHMGSRELIGYIQVWSDNDNDFKEVSSRDGGFIKSEAYIQLVEAFLKTLRLFEKYVTNITWVLEKGKDDTEDLKYIDTGEGKEKIVEMLSTLTKSKELKLIDFNKEFLNILNERLEEQKTEILDKLRDLANKQGDDQFADKVTDIQKQITQLAKEKQEAELKASQADEAREEADKARQKANEDRDKAKEDAEKANKAYEAERKRGAFQGALIGTDKERIVGLQHQIFHSSSRVNRNIKLLLRHLGVDNIDDKTKKYLKVISLESSKINSIANFITKANFNYTAEKVKLDLVDFINDYLQEMYIIKDSTIDIDVNIKVEIENNLKYIIKFRPLEITTIVDSFISNSEKAKAKNIIFQFSKPNDKLEIIISDDGKGIPQENIDRVFEMGFTTTNGSGIGLYQAHDLITNNMNGKLSASSFGKGAIFKISI